jgi:hypothetical protein
VVKGVNPLVLRVANATIFATWLLNSL